jgi:hypothetical protein
VGQAAVAVNNVESDATPPHPRDVRALRVRLGAPMDVMARAAGYQTKRSWWLVEEGKVELAPWRWQLVLGASERGELARSERAGGRQDATGCPGERRRDALGP